MKKLQIAVTALSLLFAGGAVAQDVSDAAAAGWRLPGEKGELVKVLPPSASVQANPDGRGQPVDAPSTGFTVYRASYGSGNLRDHGGLEIASAGYYQIFYNAASMSASETSGVNGFVNAFGSGIPDYTIIQQYGSTSPIAATLANRGVYLDSKGVPATISDSQLQAYLAGLFTAGAIPASASTVYGIYLPPGTQSTIGTSASCTSYCGYHSVFTWGGLQIKYAIYPYPNCSGCSLTGKSALDMLTIITSHEIREAVTDPGDNGQNAWYDRRGYEADDKCAWHNLYKVASGYWVQPEYSNANGGCVVYP